MKKLLAIALLVGWVSASNASTDVLHKPIKAMQTKNMPAESILRQVAKSSEVHLVLESDSTVFKRNGWIPK